MVGGVGLKERIRFLGQCDGVAGLLFEFDVFVFPSFREGMPRSLVGAQCMGVPAVATDIQGCKGVVVDGNRGSLVPLQESNALSKSLRYPLENEELRSAFGSKAEKHAGAKFDEDLVFQRIAQSYEKMLGQDCLR